MKMIEEDIRKEEEFLKDIKRVCQKHNRSISHEDGHGAFIIEEYNEFNINWLEEALLSEIQHFNGYEYVQQYKEQKKERF